jgi:hypothetical protein
LHHFLQSQSVAFFIFQAGETAETTKPAESCRGPSCLKVAKAGSVYCSEACIRAHAEESLQLLENEWLKGLSGRTKTEVWILL